jgi:hypothetical protein
VEPSGGWSGNKSWPLSRRLVIDHARAVWRDDEPMIAIVDLARAEADLTASELTCPAPRVRRDAAALGDGAPTRSMTTTRRTLTLRPRRDRCVACGTTQVLLPGSVLPRRADTTAVIGTALLASTRGAGYRRIAVDIARPLSTVRRWLRSVRGAHIEWLHAAALAIAAMVARLSHLRLAMATTVASTAQTSNASASLSLHSYRKVIFGTFTSILACPKLGLHSGPAYQQRCGR